MLSALMSLRVAITGGSEKGEGCLEHVFCIVHGAVLFPYDFLGNVNISGDVHFPLPFTEGPGSGSNC